MANHRNSLIILVLQDRPSVAVAWVRPASGSELSSFSSPEVGLVRDFLRAWMGKAAAAAEVSSLCRRKK